MTISFATWLRATGLGWLLGIPAIVLLALAGEAVGIGGVQVMVGVGMGTGVGLLQSLVVRSMLGRQAPWVAGSVAGWGLAAATAALADGLGAIVSLRGLAGAAAYLATISSGGLLLGTTTGLALRRLTPVR